MSFRDMIDAAILDRMLSEASDERAALAADLANAKETLQRNSAFIAANMIALISALRDIADMETPRANATVRRMAKTAREALE